MATEKSTNATIFGQDDKMTFGKYKGQLVRDVLSDNPGYLRWANENIEWFQLDEEVARLVGEALDFQDRLRKGYVSYLIHDNDEHEYHFDGQWGDLNDDSLY